jgi:hypothetical protein
VDALDAVIDKFYVFEQEAHPEPPEQEYREARSEKVEGWRDQFDGDETTLVPIFGAFVMLLALYKDWEMFDAYLDYGFGELLFQDMPDYLDLAATLEVRGYTETPRTAADFTERLAVVFAMRYGQAKLNEAKRLRIRYDGTDLERIEGQVLRILPEAAVWPLAWDVAGAQQRMEAKHGRRRRRLWRR